MDENKVLREKLAFIQDKYKEETQKLSAENTDLKALAQKLTYSKASVIFHSNNQIEMTSKGLRSKIQSSLAKLRLLGSRQIKTMQNRKIQ